eukprot:TRINITY_DN200_c0_g1_i1.p1 TRINITY_DN200_c0_g1~~TRINITY_DN200_c0_g1_i1.p1  ORF type:complete len:326 (-),score=98.36 TRINITY_DN200_c0_g1_i1:343-1320(-)
MSDITWVVSELQGRRSSNEDRTLVVADEGIFYFGVFDGHGGDEASEYVKQNMWSNIVNHETFKEKNKNYKTISEGSILKTDKDFEEHFASTHDSKTYVPGTTLTSLLIGDDGILYFSNVGDSRACAVRSGKFEQVTIDHVPTGSEKDRIEKAGGTVFTFQGCARVQGCLAVSRTIGDFMLRPYVIPNPDVLEMDSEGIEFVLIASDGLWGDVNEEDVMRTLNSVPPQSAESLKAASESLVQLALNRGSVDNISLIIIDLRNDESSVLERDDHSWNVSSTEEDFAVDVAPKVESESAAKPPKPVESESAAKPPKPEPSKSRRNSRK